MGCFFSTLEDEDPYHPHSKLDIPVYPNGRWIQNGAQKEFIPPGFPAPEEGRECWRMVGLPPSTSTYMLQTASKVGLMKG
jgi:hypothetical protein